jgi:hypothetical protein
MTSTIGTASVISLQFLTPTREGSTAWVTHVQTDTEDWAWRLLDKLTVKYPRRKWRWIRTIEDTKYPQI